jgi:hypothetical protein
MSSPLIPFRGANHVPIVGAICTFNDVQPDVLITCTCDQGAHADRLIRFRRWGDVGICRACKRLMQIKALHYVGETQQVTIEISPAVGRGKVEVDVMEPVGGQPA